MLDSVNFIIPLRLHDMLKAFHDSIFEKIIEASEQQGIRLI